MVARPMSVIGRFSIMPSWKDEGYPDKPGQWKSGRPSGRESQSDASQNAVPGIAILTQRRRLFHDLGSPIPGCGGQWLTAGPRML
jgi:hypothetical protein